LRKGKEMEPDITILDAMLSPIIPVSHKAEKESKMEELKKEESLKSETQILLNIFEKVVRIEDHMCRGAKQEAKIPDPVQLGVDAFSGVI
jgi:hypothetical protein